MDALKKMQDIACNVGDYIDAFKRKSGKKIVGVMHPIVPQELIYAAGLHPMRLFPLRKEPITKAHESLQAYTSSIFRAIWDQVLKGEYDFLDAVVLPESCETVTYFARGWQFNRPADVVLTFSGVRFHKNENGTKFFRKEAETLMKSLEELSGQKVSHQKLIDATILFNENRSLLKKIFESRKEQPPRISGADFFDIAMASSVMDKTESNVALSDIIKNSKKIDAKGKEERKRILLSGPCVIDRKLIDAIESSGAVVVVDDTNMGLRSFWTNVDLNEEPLSALSKAYAGVPCPFSTSAEDRLKMIGDLIREFNIDGVLFAIEKFCESEKMDFPYLEKNISEVFHKPVLFIETDFLCDMAPIKTRIDAFVETIS